MNELRGRRFLVVGLGVAGRAAACALADEGASVRVTEARSDVEGADALRAAGIDVRLGTHRPEDLEGVDAVVASPGVPQHAPVLAWARERGVAIWSELDVGALRCRVPYTAVTGTNGKSTTTKLLATMMRVAGFDAIGCGNIGHPFSVAAAEGHERLSVEASSFQLHFHHRFHPQVSLLLNVASDHIDWHGSFERYAAAKARIFELQGEHDTHVGNADDPRAAEISRTAACQVIWFRRGEPAEGEVGLIDGEVVSRLGAEVRLGRPVLDSAGFLADCAAAAAAAIAFGLPREAVGAAIRLMEPLPHRGEEVARADGVAFLDDSKATNVHAALNALTGRTDVVLIAGGLAKGADLSPLATAAPSLRAVVAIGDATRELIEVFDGLVPVRAAGSIEEATRSAFDLARPTGSVLLAPACASWDMFRDYVERGERFTFAARAIVEEVTA
jgi:UDP-N-acetylmuramoylalanine--D-glutamate ligase